MRWIKRGLVYRPDGSLWWASHSALTPTPILIDENTIRVYAGFRDAEGVSRIGYVELDAQNPKNVTYVSPDPVLNIGRKGAFDDNGVILGDILRVSDLELRMYYVGFQLVSKVKFLAFSGLAISIDGGKSFERYSEAPILDRSSDALYIRAIHSVLRLDGCFRVWYASGNDWEYIHGIPYPRYNIRCIESPDGIHFQGNGVLCVDVDKSQNEYRIGRPRVFSYQHKFIMHYTRGTTNGDYMAGYAESSDGYRWTRKDKDLGIGLSDTGWDSKHLCYPAVIPYKDKYYMFYNGNDMGKEGFGYAVLDY